ncbi:hypothetical protein N9L52_07745 [Litoricolaceae bacterium]|nr:hypothetical protein [Litorivicinaceae bacterium]
MKNIMMPQAFSGDKKNIRGILNAMLCKNYSSIFIFSFCFIIWYSIHPLTPPLLAANSSGWWSWWDQSNYLRITEEMLSFSIKTESFWPGYSLLATPFYFFFPGNPFIIFSFISGYILYECTRRSLERYISSFESVVISVILVCLNYKLLYQSIIIPWNTTFIYAFFSILFYMHVGNIRNTRSLFFLTILASLSFFCRPQDGFLAVVFCGYFIWTQSFGRERWVLFATLGGLVSLFAVVTALYFYVLLGGFFSAYIQSVAGHGFTFDQVPLRLYQMFFNGKLFFSSEYPQLAFMQLTPSIMIFNPLACLGVIFVLFRSIFSRKYFQILIFLGLPICYYASFNPVGNMVHFWTFSLFHYIWIYVTLFSVIGYIEVRDIFTERDFSLRNILPLAVTAGLAISSSVELNLRSVNSVSSDGVVYIDDLEFGVDKIEIRGLLGDDALFVPGEELGLMVAVNGIELVPWRDFYVNSGSGFHSIFFIDRVDSGSSISVRSENTFYEAVDVYSSGF